MFNGMAVRLHAAGSNNEHLGKGDWHGGRWAIGMEGGGRSARRAIRTVGARANAWWATARTSLVKRLPGNLSANATGASGGRRPAAWSSTEAEVSIVIDHSIRPFASDCPSSTTYGFAGLMLRAARVAG